MIFEGEIGKGNLGGIAVDDISINNHISQEDCARKYQFCRNQWSTCPGQGSCHVMGSVLLIQTWHFTVAYELIM